MTSAGHAPRPLAGSLGVLIGETDFKVGGVWGGPSNGAAYAETARICRQA